jgi:hypothetical protein
MTLDIFRSGSQDNQLLFTVELDYNWSWQQALSTIAARLPRTDIRYAYLYTITDSEDPIVAISYAPVAGALIIVNDSTTYSNLQEFSRTHGHRVYVTLRPQSNLGARRAVAGAAAGHHEEPRRLIEERHLNELNCQLDDLEQRLQDIEMQAEDEEPAEHNQSQLQPRQHHQVISLRLPEVASLLHAGVQRLLHNGSDNMRLISNTHTGSLMPLFTVAQERLHHLTLTRRLGTVIIDLKLASAVAMLKAETRLPPSISSSQARMLCQCLQLLIHGNTIRLVVQLFNDPPLHQCLQNIQSGPHVNGHFRKCRTTRTDFAEF